MAKITQQQAQYRPADSPLQCCGLCQYFLGAVHGTCTKVTGKISPFMISNQYKAAPNPTGKRYGMQGGQPVQTGGGPSQDY